MRVLVCGSRTWTDAGRIQRVLDGLLARAVAAGDHLVVIEGGARNGADRMAADWARRKARAGFPVEHVRIDAEWDRYGKRAGMIRNGRMLVEGKPDLVVAFHTAALVESRGTFNMVEQARKAGVETVLYSGLDADRSD